MQIKLVIISIFALSTILRLWQLNNIPPSLNWDEVSLGYNSYSILKTGKDEWGRVLPLSFRAFGDWKLPGYVYLDVPFIAAFGLNEWSVRLPSAVLGIGFVFLVFLILKNLSDTKTAFWGGFIASILPWTIIVSRIALEAALALFLTTLGFYLFLLGSKKGYFLVFSAVIFGLTFFSYNSSRAVTPLLVIILTFFYWKELKNYRHQAIFALLIFLTFFAIALPKALLQDSSARYRWTQILDEGAINHIEEQRRISTFPPFLTKLSANKVTFFLTEASKNYISHFSPDFLFLNGGSNYQFSVPGFGLVYPILAPFLFLGFWQIFKEKKKWQFFSLAWLLIAPVPAAITRDSPHALRSIMMIPPLIMIIVLGISWIKMRKRFVGSLIVVILLSSLHGFWKNYSGDYIKNYSWSWQYGYHQAVNYVDKQAANYDKIYFTKKYGEPHEFVLFYLQYDPAKYKSDPNLVRYQRSDWYWVDSFDKFIFVNDWEVKISAKCYKTGEKCLLVTSPGNYPEGSKLLETINFLDGKAAFDIVALPQVQ